jgi:very-short-patch-repair endonuclease
MNESREVTERVKKRLLQVFRYLAELNQVRNPATRLIDDQPWVLWLKDLPDHPSIRLNLPADGDGPGEEKGLKPEAPSPPTGDDPLLRIRRPRITRPPSPPAVLADWLLEGWDRIEGKVEARKSINQPGPGGEARIVVFDGDPARVAALRTWAASREEWARNEAPARAAAEIFERLYALHGQIEREAERVELLVGDGILRWSRPDGNIDHPILLQRLQLVFDASTPEFILKETDHPVELYTAVLRSVPEVDGRAVSICQEELLKGGYHPLGGSTTAGFLSRLAIQLSPTGELVTEPGHGGSERVLIIREPVIFVRRRTLGFAAALDGIVEDIHSREEVPESLINLVGMEQSQSAPQVEEPHDNLRLPNEDLDILFTKPANPEQLAIAKQLQRDASVLVQGPPGTGKTHTIANLIGHLLASGKRILVTSHTTKALRVLRSKVVETLQPLCVSVLERDADGRKQLEASVTGIVERLSRSTADRLDREAEVARKERTRLVEEIGRLRGVLLEARGAEYREVIVAGQGVDPAEAARIVAQGTGTHDWIPGPVTRGTPLPLSPGELTDLYATNETLSAEDERQLQLELPDPRDLPPPPQFATFISRIRRWVERADRGRAELWGSPTGPQSPEGLRALLASVGSAFSCFQSCEPWRLAALDAGRLGDEHRAVWEELLTEIQTVFRQASRAKQTILRHGPLLDDGLEPQVACSLIDEIVAHLEQGGALNWFVFLRHRPWKSLRSSVRIGSRSPRTLQDWKTLQELARLEVARIQLVARWNRQMVPLGAPGPTKLGDSPEGVLARFISPLKEALDWYHQAWLPLQAMLCREGLAWSALLRVAIPDLSPAGELLRIQEVATKDLPRLIEARCEELDSQQASRAVEDLAGHLALYRQAGAEASVLDDLSAAVLNRDPAAYEAAFERLVSLRQRAGTIARRRQLVERLEADASVWAAGLRERRRPHGGATPPGDANAAWLWRQLHDELEVRTRVSVDEVQRRLEGLSEDLQGTTAELVDRLTWAAQLRRTGLKEQRALVGWMQTIRKIGKAYGVRVPRLRAEARVLMDECRLAVPVWIMPLTRVVENFDPRTSRFDVVIIDEASQSDPMALIALYMAREAIVVGDHEQVSPETVGQAVSQVERLIEEHLRGIPNAHLYDGHTSIYDLAQTVSQTICLREHFRCVPDIIEFSNHLSYDGQIKPLRDPSEVLLRPNTVVHHVPSATVEGRVNREEALAVASLLVAAVETPDYSGKTFGVISMVGEEQAAEIDRLLRGHLSAAEYERRRILCGNAAQFQGDERDVVFLSLVDTPTGDGPLAMRDEGARGMFKKRFNVAASRARDQMWVVHSLDREVDLKSGDLRRRLIEHAMDPQALARLRERAERRAESELERLVIGRLVEAGFRVTPQWVVGYYRIDIVVWGNGRRLAVECDGDRYHPLEKLQEDMARQAILERLGWTFARIRGSQFFRNQAKAMEPVFAKLRKLGIEPRSEGLNEDQGSPPSSETRDSVIRRAEVLVRQWRTEEPPVVRVVSPGPRSTGRRGPELEPGLGLPFGLPGGSSPSSENRPGPKDATAISRDGGNTPAPTLDQRRVPSVEVPSQVPPISTKSGSDSPNSSGRTGSGDPKLPTSRAPEQVAQRLAEGDRVVHPKFGRGRVMSLSGSGESARAVVQFDRFGEKMLLLAFAQLKKEEALY